MNASPKGATRRIGDLPTDASVASDRSGSGSEVAEPVSVVIATHNRPELLGRAIAAVLSQEHEAEIEVIVVFDQAEPDHGLEHLTGDRRVVVAVNCRSAGLAGARNSGVAKASHSWIAFCDDDDEWLAGKLAGQFAALRAQPDARVATTGIFIRYDGNDTPRIPESERLTFAGFLDDRMTEVHPSATLVDRSVIAEIGDVDESIPGGYAEDYDWLLRASRVSPIAVASEPLVRVHWHGGSFFFERWSMIDEALEYLLTKYPEFDGQPDGKARIKGQQAVARAAVGRRKAGLSTAWETFRLNSGEPRTVVALAVCAGVPADWILKGLHRFGKGI